MTAGWFLRFGVVFGLVGMAMGIMMGATHDFTLMPVHAHVNLVGWVAMFLSGLFYAQNPHLEGKLSRVHLWLAVSGLLLLASGIYGSVTELAWGAPVAIVGSFVTLAATLLLAIMVFRATASQPA